VVAQGTVMVDFGEADVLIGQMPQLIKRRIDAERAA
jgi:hypothetical protein